MRAVAGDRIVVRSRHQGEPERAGEVIEVHGTDGAPPYLVRWTQDGHTSLVFPSCDAHIAAVVTETVTETVVLDAVPEGAAAGR
ncbi:MAG: putative DNA-binding protein [Mycobacterium sp.]|jgi:hypothetical protein|nr:putative DNA-binding protein [Mycobacterium sp.]MCW2745726.1 putative DNA-binding protein [Mycobacterium sp.]